MDFGTRLTEERKRMSLNQTEFGKIGGVTKTSQINYESGERKPNVDYLQAISSAGVDVQYILTGVRKEMQKGKPTGPQTAAEVDSNRLVLAIETVEEGLQETHRVMEPDKKAHLVMAVYELFKDQTPAMKQSVLRLVKSAA